MREMQWAEAYDALYRMPRQWALRTLRDAELALYRMPRQWALRTLRDAELVEVRLIVDLGLDLQEMRDSSMQRLLMRWRLYANRLHNARIYEYALQRDSEWVTMKYCFLYWKNWAQAQQHSRCSAQYRYSSQMWESAGRCVDYGVDAGTI